MKNDQLIPPSVGGGACFQPVGHGVIPPEMHRENMAGADIFHKFFHASVLVSPEARIQRDKRAVHPEPRIPDLRELRQIFPGVCPVLLIAVPVPVVKIPGVIDPEPICLVFFYALP